MQTEQLASLVRILGSLALPAPDLQVAYAELRRLDEDEAVALIAHALEERVPSLVMDRLLAWEQGNRPLVTSKALDQLWASPELRRLWHGLHTAYVEEEKVESGVQVLRSALRKRQSLIFDSLLTVMRQATSAGVPLLVLKGCSLLPRYPDGTRDLSDVDILVPDSSAGWQLSRSLAKCGYSVAAADLSRRGPGLIGLKIDLDHPTAAGVDVHCGTFDMVGNLALRAPLWERSEQLSLDGRTAAAPSPEDALLVLAAHRSREGSIHLRDLNDAYVLVHDQRIDWNYLGRTAEDNGLAEILDLLLEATGSKRPPMRSRPIVARFTKLLSPPEGQGFTWTAPLRALPYRAATTLDFDRKQHGWRWALPHVVATTLVDIEKHLAWAARNSRLRFHRQAATRLRQPLLRLLGLWPWTLSAPPAWTSIRLRPVEEPVGPRFIADGSEQRGPVAVDGFDPEVVGHDSMVAITARRRDCPDFLVTEGGVLYSSGYTAAYPHDSQSLHRWANGITAELLRLDIVRADPTAWRPSGSADPQGS
ncbi:nucleotidyltransferase family protein [Kribbella sp. CA-293567]|uniref:nucleotidyltransferase family protein n=1 Tax=Kribbella sp. CA-293567 TaxID=3002436 RepID=UPI0022DE6696|nr:nucleotidyltransferase family protein [Kribbella sp. CA-293567]WBQ03895.1 nucleotidyltransferase family protein [Kribbella sp. CA-293567]